MKSTLDKTTGMGRPGEWVSSEDLPRRLEMRTVAECVAARPEAMVLRRAAGKTPTELTTAEREQLIADARAGKLVKVEVEAVTFLQRDTPNRNLVRFSPGALRSLAPSFAGMPVLRDHEQGDSQARAGRILESKLEDSPDEKDVKQIRMTLELVAPWAVEMALRGLMDRFSIGWHSTGDTVCSICSEPMTQFWFWTFGECDHQLGEEYDGQICQLEFTSAEGVEVSAVSVPAVLGTGVDDIRAQLSAARAAGPTVKGRKELSMSKQVSLTAILAALTLGADADEGAAVAEIQSREMLLKAEKSRADGLQAQVEKLQAEGLARRKAELLERAKREGKVLPGSDLERELDKLADTSISIAEALVKDLPRLAPIGAPPVAAGADPTPKADPEVATAASLTPAQLKVAKDMGVSPEAYAEQLNKKRKGGR